MDITILKKEITNNTILVVGDVMLDKTLIGDTTRISPEAPVPIVKWKKTTENLGGAGNVANNIAQLDAPALLLGITGEDESAGSINRLSEANNIDGVLLTDASFTTTTKMRIVSAGQQITRIDFENPLKLTSAMRQNIENLLEKLVPLSKALVLSDYNKGFLQPSILKAAIDRANFLGIPSVVDPKQNNWTIYQNATMLTPNLNELSATLDKTVENTDAKVSKALEEVVKKYKLKNVLLTRGAKGMTLITNGNIIHQNSTAKEVFDVSGAGDTVVALMAVMLASGKTILESMPIANLCAGMVVGKHGAATITLEELLTNLEKTNATKNRASQSI